MAPLVAAIIGSGMRTIDVGQPRQSVAQASTQGRLTNRITACDDAPKTI
jgi:hypothetical protein